MSIPFSALDFVAERMFGSWLSSIISCLFPTSFFTLFQDDKYWIVYVFVFQKHFWKNIIFVNFLSVLLVDVDVKNNFFKKILF
jgi:hypothetical protein